MGGVRGPPGGPGGVGREGRGREVLPDCWEGFGGPIRRAMRGWDGWRRSGVPPGGLERVGRSSRRAGRGHEALPESQEGSQGLEKIKSFSWWAGRGWVTLLEGCEGQGGPLGGLGEHGRPSQRTGRGQEVLPEGWEESEGHPEGLGGVRSLSQCAERESGGPPRGMGGAGRPSWRAERTVSHFRRAGRGWVVRERSGDLQDGWEGSRVPSGETGEYGRTYRMARKGRETPQKGARGVGRPSRKGGMG